MSNLLKQVAEPQDKNTTFIYALLDPRWGCIRYIGKADDPKRRYNAHFSKSELSPNTKKVTWFKSLLALGLKPILVVLEEVAQENWEEAEMRWIAWCHSVPGYPKLTNGTIGGDGSKKGSKHSEETRRKIGLGHKGKIIPAETVARTAASLRTAKHKNSISGYKGVYWKKSISRWICTSQINRKFIGIGSFPPTEDGKTAAAHAYDRWVIQNLGPDAYTNFPRHDYS